MSGVTDTYRDDKRVLTATFDTQGGANLADNDRAGSVAGPHDQRKRQDGEATELDQRAHPEIWHAAPAEHRFMRVGAESNDCAERRGHQGQ